jgi:hypothetical protein
MEEHLGDRINGRYGGLERWVTEGEQKAEIALEMSHTELESGRVDMVKNFDDLKLEVNRINRFLKRENMSNAHGKPRILHNYEQGGPSSSTIALESTFNLEARHRARPCHRDIDPTPSSSHGVAPPPPQNHAAHTAGEDYQSRQSQSHFDSVRTSQGRLPKLHFPVFNGDDLQLWRSRCENYFNMYGVEASLWVHVTSMHLQGPVVRWLQSVEKQLKNLSWDGLCAWIHDRFSRDQHEALMCQMFHIHQS